MTPRRHTAAVEVVDAPFLRLVIRDALAEPRWRSPRVAKSDLRADSPRAERLVENVRARGLDVSEDDVRQALHAAGLDPAACPRRPTIGDTRSRCKAKADAISGTGAPVTDRQPPDWPRSVALIAEQLGRIADHLEQCNDGVPEVIRTICQRAIANGEPPLDKVIDYGRTMYLPPRLPSGGGRRP